MFGQIAALGRTKIQDLQRRLAAWRWKRRHRNHLCIFNFHQVSPIFEPGLHSPFTWTPLSSFEAQLDYAAAHYKILGLEEALLRLRRGDLPGPTAAITFDDGDVSNAQYSIPLLEERGIPATLFINSATFEGSGHYWFSVLTYLQHAPQQGSRRFTDADLRQRQQSLRKTADPALYVALKDEVERLVDELAIPRRKCVTPEWLANLDENLFSIGAHGHEHQRYSMMPPDWQRVDLRRNLGILRQFKSFRPMFAYPFGRKGDFNDATLQVALENNVTVLGADGGINCSPEPVVLRIPSDSRSLQETVVREMAGEGSGRG